MRQIADGIAHVSFRGGGTFLPARTPYDRQILVEYVRAYLGANGQVQVLVEGQRWMVHLSRNSVMPCCLSCGCSADSACYSTAHGEEAQLQEDEETEEDDVNRRGGSLVSCQRARTPWIPTPMQNGRRGVA